MSSNVVIHVTKAGTDIVNGRYISQNPKNVPVGFTNTCKEQGWDHITLWKQLNDEKESWYLHENGSYIYRNKGDGKWWIDAPDGGGVYISEELTSSWKLLPNAQLPAPTVRVENE